VKRWVQSKREDVENFAGLMCDMVWVFRIVVDAVAFTGCFVHVFSFELDSVFSMSYPKVLANNGCAHRARDGAIMSRFALDVKGNTVGSFRLDLEVGWQR
jgi:hypothetical protein